LRKSTPIERSIASLLNVTRIRWVRALHARSIVHFGIRIEFGPVLD